MLISSFGDISTEKDFSSGKCKADHQQWQTLRERGATRLCKPTNVCPSQDSPALGPGIRSAFLCLKKLYILTVLQNHLILNVGSVFFKHSSAKQNVFAGHLLSLPLDGISRCWIIISSSCCHCDMSPHALSSDPVATTVPGRALSPAEEGQLQDQRAPPSHGGNLPQLSRAYSPGWTPGGSWRNTLAESFWCKIP